jgi:hypothetical protein
MRAERLLHVHEVCPRLCVHFLRRNGSHANARQPWHGRIRTHPAGCRHVNSVSLQACPEYSSVDPRQANCVFRANNPDIDEPAVTIQGNLSWQFSFVHADVDTCKSISLVKAYVHLPFVPRTTPRHSSSITSSQPVSTACGNPHTTRIRATAIGQTVAISCAHTTVGPSILLTRLEQAANILANDFFRRS